jgi:Putative beta barrel porin-7 (BBP7)
MNKRFIIVAMLLAAVPLAHGQDAVEKQAQTEEKEQSLFTITPHGKIIPESAEAAEDLAAVHHQPERFWVRSEFLIWWIKTANLPPLVTTSLISDSRPGALGSPATDVNFGRTRMDFQDRGGGRFTFGWWLNDERQWGLEANYFFLSGRSLGQTFVSPGNPVLARPFFNANGGFQDSLLIAFPGIVSGGVEVYIPSFLQGAEANFTSTLAKSESVRCEALGGFRFLNLDDSLHIGSRSVVTLAPNYKFLGIPYDGRTIRVNDRFDSRNDFYGAQLGGRVELRRKRFTLDLLAKAALGVSRETITISGSTTIDSQPAQNGGLYALSSNSGQFSRNVFAVVPEVGFNLKFELTNHIRLFGGYSFLYWSSTARPWDHVDSSVNVNLIPTSSSFGAAGGAARPAFAFNSSSFFAQGANFGVEFHY